MRHSDRVEILIWAVVIATLGGMLAICSGPTAEDVDQAQYCDMVHLGKTSGDPAIGWPDYKRTYDKWCDGPRPKQIP